MISEPVDPTNKKPVLLASHGTLLGHPINNKVKVSIINGILKSAIRILIATADDKNGSSGDVNKDYICIGRVVLDIIVLIIIITFC